MAVRYSFILIPDPSFLRLIHTSRQILCNQFGCWTAEMFMIHVPLINFFQSTPEEIESNKGLINQIVNDVTNKNLVLVPTGITKQTAETSDLYINCTYPNGDSPFEGIRDRLIEELKIEHFDNKERVLQIPLLENFQGSNTVFEEALEMATDLFDNFGLDTPFDVKSLNLVKYHSRTASEEWEREKWCSDISWDILESFKLG